MPVFSVMVIVPLAYVHIAASGADGVIVVPAASLAVPLIVTFLLVASMVAVMPVGSPFHLHVVSVLVQT